MKVFYRSVLFITTTLCALVGAATADVISSQTFETDQNMDGVDNLPTTLADNNGNGLNDVQIFEVDGNVLGDPINPPIDATAPYIGTGLGFFGLGAMNPGSGTFGPSGGVLNARHLTSDSSRILTTGQYGVTFNNQPDSAAFLFDSVDLSGHTSKSFSMDVAQPTAFLDTDDDLVIRLYLNGSTTGIDLLSTLAAANGELGTAATGGGATFSGGLLSYNFLDSDTSAILYLAITADDGDAATAEGYTFDNVSFDGTEAIPEPATLGLVAAFGGGLLFVRRRRVF